VPVQMIVRGICCIKAGLTGLSENVTVRSVVGRYLEHSRVYCFGCEDNVRVYIASGDFLTRNTQRRVEAGVHILDQKIIAQLCALLQIQLADNVNAHEMQPDGTYVKVKQKPGEPVVDSQLDMYTHLSKNWSAIQSEGPASAFDDNSSALQTAPARTLWQKICSFFRAEH
ncbi:MAG: polyphosphate kinase 1, partial [Ruthenibacterium sp.]